MNFKIVFAVVIFTFFSFSTAEVCRDIGGNCAVLDSFCDRSLIREFWCRKACGHCTDHQTGPPTTPTRPTITTQGPSFTPVCGKPYGQPSYVIAGQNARENAWPWQILMLKNYYPSCGGTIIAPQWVVTAAHCVDSRTSIDDYRIRVSELDTQVRSGFEINYKVEKIIVHEKWNTNNLQNDIALIKLQTPIKFNQRALPACLPSQEVPIGAECYITGWGKINHPGQMHSKLQQAKLPVVSNKVCHRKNYPNTGITITNSMICGGYDHYNAQKSGCHGDSGGPYVCKIGGSWEIHGAVSHGSGDCDATKTYTVFSRIYYYKSWMVAKMKTN